MPEKDILTVFFLTICLVCVDTYQSCDLTLPRRPVCRDDRATHTADRRKRSSYLNVLQTKFQNCDECLTIKDTNYVICKSIPTCTTGGDDRSNDADSPPLTTTSSTATVRTTTNPNTGTPVIVGIGAKPDIAETSHKYRSCNGWGIGMLVFGIFLGSLSMAVLCVFVPSLHRNVSRKLNRNVSKRMKKTNLSTEGNNVTETMTDVRPTPIYPHQAPTETQVNDQPMYLELDQEEEPGEYQTLSRYDAPAGHMYMPLDLPDQGIYNAVEVEAADQQNTETVAKDTDHMDVTDKMDSRNKGSNLHIISKTNEQIKEANYFVLEPNSDSGESTGITTLKESVWSSSTNQPEYFILQPTNEQVNKSPTGTFADKRQVKTPDPNDRQRGDGPAYFILQKQ